MIFRAQQFEFRFPRPTLIMGVVNVTPDSFSDGGRYLNTQAAVNQALELVRQGADILDIGGESTRPGAEPVSEPEELRRVVPVLEELRARTGVPLSIDTMKPGVARAALAAGACMVNDVAAGRNGPAMWEVVAASQAGYVIMHAAGTPPTMQDQPAYGNVVAEVDAFFSRRLAELARHGGISAEQLVLDPGIGFGKSLAHNLQLLARLGCFTKWQRPVLLGVSRKSFIEMATGARLNERLPGSLACAALAVQAGAGLIRVHDVAETVQAVRLTEAILQQPHAD